MQEIREILYGGPDGDGLVPTVARMVRIQESHQKILVGNGKEGLAGQVRRHDSFIRNAKDNQKWLLRLVAAQFLVVLSGFGWMILQAAISGG